MAAMPGWFWGASFAVLGAIAGSFIATLCLRWPEGRSVLAGRSHCDGCGRTLGAMDLVPLLSALSSRGRCRSCGAAIDPVHGRIELASLVAGAGPFVFLPPLSAAIWATMAWLLIPLVWLDRRYLWLPDRLVVLLAATGLAVGVLLGDATLGGATLSGPTLGDRLIGGAAGWAVLAAIGWVFRRLRGVEGLGGGDPKLIGALGLWLGWQALPLLLLLASSMGLALALIDARHVPLKQQRIPLGSMLGLSGMFMALYPALR